jgi:pilus assembly protein Flp/PilA
MLNSLKKSADFVAAKIEIAKANLKARNISGATAIEYGLIASLIGVAVVAAVDGLGTQLGATFNTVNSKLT